jgi:hypothetical protein
MQGSVFPLPPRGHFRAAVDSAGGLVPRHAAATSLRDQVARRITVKAAQQYGAARIGALWSMPPVRKLQRVGVPVRMAGGLGRSSPLPRSPALRVVDKAPPPLEGSASRWDGLIVELSKRATVCPRRSAGRSGHNVTDRGTRVLHVLSHGCAGSRSVSNDH